MLGDHYISTLPPASRRFSLEQRYCVPMLHLPPELGLLLLLRAIGEHLVLGELEMDQSRDDDQHPETNKGRD